MHVVSLVFAICYWKNLKLMRVLNTDWKEIMLTKTGVAIIVDPFRIHYISVQLNVNLQYTNIPIESLRGCVSVEFQ